MRKYILPVLLCVVFFILPLQIFIIGNNSGIGVQGAIYRYQVSDYGTSFILIPRDLTFVLDGTYSGRTALSVNLWFLAAILLACTTIFSLIHFDDFDLHYKGQILISLSISCLIFLASCVAQYGIFFNGPAGISLPVGIGMILIWIAFDRFVIQI